jgi:thioredoxin reductase (NADPH)
VFTVDEIATLPLFSTLAGDALEYLAGAVEDIHLVAGEYVAHEGEGRFLAVVVEGRAELTKLVNDVEQVIGVRLPGELGGEIPMTLGTPLPASMRAIEPSRVMKVPIKVFHKPRAERAQIRVDSPGRVTRITSLKQRPTKHAHRHVVVFEANRPETTQLLER